MNINVSFPISGAPRPSGSQAWRRANRTPSPTDYCCIKINNAWGVVCSNCSHRSTMASMIPQRLLRISQFLLKNVSYRLTFKTISIRDENHGHIWPRKGFSITGNTWRIFISPHDQRSSRGRRSCTLKQTSAAPPTTSPIFATTVDDFQPPYQKVNFQ